MDEVVREPLGGAHRDPLSRPPETLKGALLRHLNELEQVSLEQLLAARETRLRRFGAFTGN